MLFAFMIGIISGYMIIIIDERIIDSHRKNLLIIYGK